MAPPPSGPTTTSSYSTSNLPVPPRHVPPGSKSSSNSLAFPQSATLHNLTDHGAQIRSSRTWTTSSGELGLMSDTDEFEDRFVFVQEYNRLAKKHGVRILVVDDFKPQKPQEKASQTPEKKNWLARILRSTSNGSPVPLKPGTKQSPLKHRRSVSDIAHNLVSTRCGPPRSLDLQSMVRLSGKAVFYLPTDHAPGSLVLPTCIRATAHYLAQHTATGGIFRIPGSVRIVNAIFNYYCYLENGGTDVAGTVRCPNLPEHINASVHDVASTFKRMLSVLPGGILGTLSIFDAFVAINSHLHGEPEFPRTKQTKLRARLIAAAIGTVESQFRRELICAVFGLLSLIGRTAEVTPREDENGRPLPTGDLMGYSALGIVFGPLLVGELLDQYDMHLAAPNAGMLLMPLTPKKLQKSSKDKKKAIKGTKTANGPSGVDKIHIANNIAEMLIANWRDIVRQMKQLGTHHRKITSSLFARNGSLRPSISETFFIKQPPEWEQSRRESAVQVNREGSPEPQEPQTPTLGPRRLRPSAKRSTSSNRLRTKPSGTALSPTAEEGSAEDYQYSTGGNAEGKAPHLHTGNTASPRFVDQTSTYASPRGTFYGQSSTTSSKGRAIKQNMDHKENISMHSSPVVTVDNVPPRISSKHRPYTGTPSEDDSSPNQAGDRFRRWDFNDQATLEFSQMPDPQPRLHRNSMVSHGSQASFNPANKAVEARLGPSSEIGMEDFEAMTPLHKHAYSDRSSDAVTADQTQPHQPASLLKHAVTPQEDFESGAQTKENITSTASRHIPEASVMSSIGATPKRFYAPMRTPPTLMGETPGTGTYTPTRAYRDSKRSVAGNASNNTPQISTARDGSSILKPLHKASSSMTTLHNRSKSLATGFEKQEASPPDEKRRKRSDHKAKGASDYSSSSETGSKRAGVKAMAAMFEAQDQPAQHSPSRPRRDSRGWTTATQSTPSLSKPIEPSNPGSLVDAHGFYRPWGSPSHPGTSAKSSFASLKDQRDSTTSTLRTSAGDSVAMRAGAIMEAEKQHQGPNTVRPPLAGLRQTATTPKQQEDIETFDTAPSKKQDVFNLGTMVPHPEQPPIAQHLNRARPPSAASNANNPDDEAARAASTPTPRPGSTTSLHAQIRNLQRQLNAKTEDAAQLRRQLEAQENSDVGTLSQQLRETKRELYMWRDRAEAAERRVKVFEKFTAKLKGIRDASAVREQAAVASEPQHDVRSGSKDSCFETSPKEQVRILEGHRSDKRTISVDSGHTEDAGVVTARIRKCLHGSSGSRAAASHDGTIDDGSGEPDLLGLDRILSHRPSMTSRNFSLGAAEIWMAAQELLLDE